MNENQELEVEEPKKKKKLKEIYKEKGLLTPTQFKKRVPQDQRDQYELVKFPWGDQMRVGYRL